MPIYKNGEYYIVKISINGRQILRRKYLGRKITSKEQALLCERDLNIQYNEQLSNYKIDDLFNLFEEYLFKKYKETSAKRYLNSFNLVIKKYFAGRELKDITNSYLEYVNDSINNLSYKGIFVYIFLCKTFIKFLFSYGLKVNVDKLYAYKRKKIKKPEFNFYSLEEFKKLISVMSNNEDKLIFSLLFYYGLRVGELRGLKVEDFQNDRVSINKEVSNKGRFGGQIILDPKTSSSFRFYPYIDDIKLLFDSLIKEKQLNKNDFLFKRTNGVIGETTIRRKLKEYCEIAKLKVIKIHEFRHSCATFLINKDVDVKDIANWLGHSSPNVTLSVYAHLLPVRKEKIKDLFNES